MTKSFCLKFPQFAFKLHNFTESDEKTEAELNTKESNNEEVERARKYLERILILKQLCCGELMAFRAVVRANQQHEKSEKRTRARSNSN